MRLLFFLILSILLPSPTFALERQFKIVKDPETGKDKQVYITGLKTKKRRDGSVLYVMSLKDGYMDGPTIHYYPDGKIEYEESFHKDIREGHVKRYFPDGELKLIVDYQNGLKQGEQIIYKITQNGEKVQHVINHYDRGLMDGIQQYFNQDGVLYRSNTYRPNFDDNNEYLHGPEISYYDNQQVQNRKHYLDGRLHGLIQSYHKNGQIEKEICYQSGRKQKGLNVCKGHKDTLELVQVYFADGRVKHEYQIKDGKLNGFSKTYHENRQLIYNKHYNNDRKDGREEEFDKEGVMLKSSNWKKGLKHGVTQRFFDDGTLRNQIGYSDGKLHGKSFKYHANGQLSISGSYAGGNKHGNFKYYSENKFLFLELSYKHDVLHGSSKGYGETGTVKKCIFNEGSLVDCKEVKIPLDV